MKVTKCRIKTLVLTLLPFGFVVLYACIVIRSFHAVDINVWYGSVYSQKKIPIPTRETLFPLRIHQIFFYINDGDSIPVDMILGQRSWKDTPGFNYTMWTEQMVLDLITSDYPGLLTMYKSYGHWVRQIDVARYVILHRYGGVFVDMDIKQRDLRISNLYSFLPKATTCAMYRTKPFGFATDFIVAKPGDSFLTHVISGLPSAHRSYVFPYLTTMLSTGPAYLTLRYRTFPNKDVVTILDDDILSIQYIRHMQGGTWQGWDGQLILFVFNHPHHVVYFSFICVVMMLVLIKKSQTPCVRHAFRMIFSRN